MDAYIDLLKSAALDPFSVATHRSESKLAIDVATPPETLANGTWWMCEGCCDPGPDEFPEHPLPPPPPGEQGVASRA